MYTRAAASAIFYHWVELTNSRLELHLVHYRGCTAAPSGAAQPGLSAIHSLPATLSSSGQFTQSLALWRPGPLSCTAEAESSSASQYGDISIFV